MRYLLCALLCAALMGCVASGTQVKEQQLSQFKAGETTYQQVIGTLGPPNSSSLMPDGTRMIAYTYVQAAARPESFIPIVGPFVGGADVHSNMVMFRFNADGKLMDFTSTATQVGSGRNLEAGSPPSRNDEPKASNAP
ncbi:MAG TPA: hypothetical protein VMS78_15290 [Rhizomicrobium sp.]|nr:hypothetical protein [Rhizomicrobium sp.]